MIPWLSRKKKGAIPTQLDAVRKAASLDASELPVAQVFPVLVPASFFALGNWFGPYEILELPGVGLTWAVFLEDQTMRYVDRGTVDLWRSQSFDWRAVALSNLDRDTAARPWTHEFKREDGTIYAVGLMHPDANGPARVLLQRYFIGLFPEGYQIALPEMSCGVVVSATASEKELGRIRSTIDACFRGTRPLVEGLHDPKLLLAKPTA